MAKCQCGLLEKEAQDPKIPVTYHPDTNNYSLDLTEDFSVPDIYCMFCGGYDPQIIFKIDYHLCHCGKLKSWAEDPTLPIRFDSKLNKFTLLLKQENLKWNIYFCPACGSRMPQSNRDKLFLQPSQQDMKKIQKKLDGVISIEQVIKALGEPDEKHGPMTSPQQEKQIYGIKDTKQSLIYKFPAKSFMLYVCQYEDDTLGFSFSGFYKKHLSLSNRVKYYRYRIKKYLQRFNIVLWQYAPDTPVEKFLRHHKIARRIIYPCFFCIISSMSLLASAFVFDSKIEGMMAAILGIIGGLLFVPSIFAFVWANEIEKTLKKRGQLLPYKLRLENRIPIWALQMMLWFAGLVVLASIIHKE